MRPLRVLAVYLAAVFLGGALLAPWVYFIAQWAAEQSSVFKGIANEPFHRYVNRCLIVAALAGLWPTAKALGLQSAKDLGMAGFRGEIGRLGMGFLLGFGSLAIVALLATLGGGRAWDLSHDAARYTKHLLNAGLAALAVPVIEELLFRGVVFGGLRKGGNWQMALVVSSVIYALVHFLERPPAPETVGWSSGLALLPRMMRGFGNIEQLVPGFFSLTFVGALLALAYQRTGALYFSMGLHGGWIFWMKSYGFLTREVPGANTAFWGTGKVTEGWLCLLVLAVVAVPVWRLTARGKSDVPESQS
ncbi:MAG: type II CAAX endopeptidase family protein [Verrucomicrobiota bacterium]